MADKNKLGEFYTRPKELGKWEGFKQFLWNSETSECLGRTGGSWGKSQFFFREILSESLRNVCEGKKTWTIVLHFKCGKIDFSKAERGEVKCSSCNR